jgi:hypothetical protein
MRHKEPLIIGVINAKFIEYVGAWKMVSKFVKISMANTGCRAARN